MKKWDDRKREIEDLLRRAFDPAYLRRFLREMEGSTHPKIVETRDVFKDMLKDLYGENE